jgi:drug/metabolite transporter (DMT)-like permease
VAAPSPRPFTLAAALLAVYVIWGSTYLAMLWVVEAIPPFLGASVRWLIAGTLLYAWVKTRGAPRPTRNEWLAATLIGGLLLVGGNGGVMWAEQYVASGFAALMIATVPLLMALLDPLFGGPRPTLPVTVALLTGFAGVGFLVWDRLAWHDAHLGAVLVLGLAALLWAIGSLWSRSVPRSRVSLQAAAMQMLTGGVLLVAFGLLTGEGPRFHPEAVPLRSWLALGYLVVFGSFVAYTSYIWLLQVASPTLVGTYAYVNPIVAVLLGAFLAAEALTTVTVIGALIVLASVASVTLIQGRRAVIAKPMSEAPTLVVDPIPVTPEETRDDGSTQ